jgi:hypothetical protein
MVRFAGGAQGLASSPQVWPSRSVLSAAATQAARQQRKRNEFIIKYGGTFIAAQN